MNAPCSAPLTALVAVLLLASTPPLPAQAAAAPALRRASELMGSRVLDADGKDVGRIEDVVVDPQDGRVLFAAVSAGKYLSPGDPAAAEKLVGLPLETLKANGDHYALQGVSRASLANVSLFTRSSWPAADNRDWIAMLWKHFDRTPYWSTVRPPLPAPAPRNASSAATPGATPAATPAAPAAPSAPAASTTSAPDWTSARLSVLLHTTVRNRSGDELGKADDLVVDTGGARLAYAVVTPATALGLSDKLIAVPWGAITHAAGRLLIEVDKARYASAPSFSRDHWPDMSSTSWVTGVKSFFPEHAAAAGT